MAANRPMPSRYSGRLIAITVAVCARDWTGITPGTIGFPGKWPGWYHSLPVKVCSATARTPGSSSVTRSMSRNGSRCGMSASMPALSSVVNLRRVYRGDSELGACYHRRGPRDKSLRPFDAVPAPPWLSPVAPHRRRNSSLREDLEAAEPQGDVVLEMG